MFVESFYGKEVVIEDAARIPEVILQCSIKNSGKTRTIHETIVIR